MRRDILVELVPQLVVGIEVLKNPRGARVFFRVDNQAVATIKVSAEEATIEWAVPLFVRLVRENALLNLARDHWKTALC
jgi:hypothetical protein